MHHVPVPVPVPVHVPVHVPVPVPVPVTVPVPVPLRTRCDCAVTVLYTCMCLGLASDVLIGCLIRVNSRHQAYDDVLANGIPQWAKYVECRARRPHHHTPHRPHQHEPTAMVGVTWSRHTTRCPHHRRHRHTLHRHCGRDSAVLRTPRTHPPTHTLAHCRTRVPYALVYPCNTS